MKTLRWNAVTSLVDLITLAVPLLSDRGSRLVLIQTVPMVYAYWIPLVGIMHSFKQMDNMWDTFWLLVC